MLIPAFLIGAVASSAGYGLKQGVDAQQGFQRADELVDQAAETIRTANLKLGLARAATADLLADLGRRKLQVLEQELGRFARLYSKVVEREFNLQIPEVERLTSFSPADLHRMTLTANRANEALMAGGAGLTVGALVGVAAYSGVAMLGSATTGTAIATLSGAAATNATLAWFGGGALTAGGFGMAGGALALGGVVLGPAMAVGGIYLAFKGQQAASAAEERLAQARRIAAELQKGTTEVRRIEHAALDVKAAILKLQVHLATHLNSLQRLLIAKGIDPTRYAEVDRRLIRQIGETAGIIQRLLESPLLTEEGAYAPECQGAVEEARRLLLCS